MTTKTTLIWYVIIALIVGWLIGHYVGPRSYSNSSEQVSTTDSNNATELYASMRKLWTDHVIWTREYVLAAASGTANAQTAASRLLKNQEDIGNLVANYYNQDAGSKLTALLKEHINLAVAVVADAKAGNTDQFNVDNEKWKQNGNDIADFLASANPNWPQDTLRDMMAKHLSLLTDQVNDTLKKNYAASVTDFDAGLDHILMMADALSGGIVKQFPDKF